MEYHALVEMDLACANALLDKARGKIDSLTAEVARMKKDQGDWRKGVGLIASALGEVTPINLCCSRIADEVLEFRADLATAQADLATASERVTERNETIQAMARSLDEAQTALATARRNGARLACDLCHCCGEQRHDGDEPCVSCEASRSEERAACLKVMPQKLEHEECTNRFDHGYRVGWNAGVEDAEQTILQRGAK